MAAVYRVPLTTRPSPRAGCWSRRHDPVRESDGTTPALLSSSRHFLAWPLEEQLQIPRRWRRLACWRPAWRTVNTPPPASRALPYVLQGAEPDTPRQCAGKIDWQTFRAAKILNGANLPDGQTDAAPRGERRHHESVSSRASLGRSHPGRKELLHGPLGRMRIQAAAGVSQFLLNSRDSISRVGLTIPLAWRLMRPSRNADTGGDPCEQMSRSTTPSSARRNREGNRSVSRLLRNPSRARRHITFDIVVGRGPFSRDRPLATGSAAGTVRDIAVLFV